MPLCPCVELYRSSCLSSFICVSLQLLAAVSSAARQHVPAELVDTAHGVLDALLCGNGLAAIADRTPSEFWPCNPFAQNTKLVLTAAGQVEKSAHGVSAPTLQRRWRVVTPAG